MTTTDYSIRPAGNKDRAQWDPLWRAYLEFYQSSLTQQVTDLLWQRLLDPAHEIQCLLAAAPGGNLVGLVHFFPHAHTWYANPICYINDLYVLPDTRGCGIGKMLIEAVVEEAGRRQWAEVYWQTQHHNSVARGLYDKLTGGPDGFVIYSIEGPPR